MAKNIFLFVIVSIVSSLVSSRCSRCTFQNNDSAMKRLINGIAKVSGEHLNEHFQKHRNESYSVAILPLFCILGHLAYSTEGDQLERILKYMNLNSRDEIGMVLPAAVELINNDPDTKLKVAFKVFGDDSQKFTKSYKQNFKNICDGQSGLVDYDCPDEALQEVNKWFTSETNFNTIMSTDSIIFNKDDKKGIVYATSMDYLYSLDHETNPNYLTTVKFPYSKTRSMISPSLQGRGYVKYGKFEDLDAQFIQFLIKGGKNSIALIQPNNDKCLLELVKKLQDPNVLYGVFNRAKWMCVNMHLTLGSAIVSNDLFEYVQKLCLNGTNFSNVFESRDPAHVEYGFQKLQLILDPVTRKGPRDSMLCPSNDVPFVNFNRAFVYYGIAPNGMLIFAGILNGPENYTDN